MMRQFSLIHVLVYLIVLGQAIGYLFHQPQRVKLSSSSRRYATWKEDAVTGFMQYQEPRSVWCMFKDSVYESLDSLRRFRDNRKARTAVATSLKDKVFNGYSDTVEKSILASPYIQTQHVTPGARLLKEFEESIRSDSQSFSTLNDDSRSKNIFDTSKDFFYDKLDVIKPRGKVSEQPEAFSSLDLKFKAVARASLKKVEPVVKSVSPTSSPLNDDLESRNPIKSVKARISFLISERNRKRLLFKEDVQNQIELAKQTMYVAVDGIKEVGDTIVRIPEETNRKVRELVDDVTAIPERIQSAAQSVKDAVDDSLRITTVIVQDIQNIPLTIQENIHETSIKIDQTKESINQKIQQVQDLSFKAKVLFGLEEAKSVELEKSEALQPPSREIPKLKSNPHIAFERAGSVLASLAKVALYLGKGLVEAGISASKVARVMYEDSKRKQEERLLKRESTITVVSPSISLAEIDPTLDRTVSEALRLASEAMTKSSDNQAVEVPPVSTSRRSLMDPTLEMEISKGILLAESVTKKEEDEKKNTEVSVASVILAQIDPNLEREVSEALRLEAESINKASQIEKKHRKKNDILSAEVEVALSVAKAAAAQAISDAAELEKIVKKQL